MINGVAAVTVTTNIVATNAVAAQAVVTNGAAATPAAAGAAFVVSYCLTRVSVCRPSGICSSWIAPNFLTRSSYSRLASSRFFGAILNSCLDRDRSSWALMHEKHDIEENMPFDLLKVIWGNSVAVDYFNLPKVEQER